MTPAGQSAPPTAGRAAGKRHHWLVFASGGDELAVSFVDPVDHAQVLADYPLAYAAMPWAGLQERARTNDRPAGKATISTKAPRAQRSVK
jgi:hypothetical protein